MSLIVGLAGRPGSVESIVTEPKVSKPSADRRPIVAGHNTQVATKPTEQGALYTNKCESGMLYNSLKLVTTQLPTCKPVLVATDKQTNESEHNGQGGFPFPAPLPKTFFLHPLSFSLQKRCLKCMT